MTGDPVRLVDTGSEASAHLRGLLESARADAGTKEEVRTVSAALGGLLGPGPLADAGPDPSALGAPEAATTTGGAGAGALGGIAGKLAGALAIAGLVGGGAVWYSRTQPPGPASTVVAAPVAATTSAPAEPAVAPGRDEPHPVEKEPPDEPLEAAPAREEARAVATPPPPSSAPASGPSEVRLLADARRALAADPRRALALTQEHRRRFPQGQLRQEREVIAIDALERLGQKSEAADKARAFEQTFPGSAHKRKVETTVNPD